MRFFDLALIAAYLIGITWFGAHFRHSQKTLRDYFLGGRNAPWWAIAFSIVSAETSTLTVIGTPALAFKGNFGFLQVVLGYLLARIVISILFLPQYFRGDLFTAYELMERRFGMRLRRLTAGRDRETLHQRGKPSIRLADDQVHPRAGKDFRPIHFAAQRFAVSLHHEERAGIEFARDIELSQRPVPVPSHAEQLKQEHPQPGVRRISADVLLQLSQRFLEPPRTEGFLGAHGPTLELAPVDMGQLIRGYSLAFVAAFHPATTLPPFAAPLLSCAW